MSNAKACPAAMPSVLSRAVSLRFRSSKSSRKFSDADENSENFGKGIDVAPVDRNGREKCDSSTILQFSGSRSFAPLQRFKTAPASGTAPTCNTAKPQDKRLRAISETETARPGFSKLLQLPLEIKQMIYREYFPNPEAVIKLKKLDSEPVWNEKTVIDEVLSLLLTCREIYSTARPMLKLTSVALDLRQYVQPDLPVKEIGDYYRKGSLSCSKLIIRDGQSFNSGISQAMPNLKCVIMYDYGTFRNLAPASDHRTLASNFEYGARKLVKDRAMKELTQLKLAVPEQVDIKIICVCDCLICLEDEDLTLPIPSKGKPVKMRHLVTFDDQHLQGALISRDWITTGAGLGLDACPLPLKEQLATHVHAYCGVVRETLVFP